MSAKTSPKLGGGGASGGLQFPLVAPMPGAAGSEPFAFATGGGMHGNSDGSTAFTSKFGDVLVADTQGGGNFPNALKAQGLATLAGGVSTTNISAATLQTTGNANFGGSLGVAGNTSITGTLAAASIASQGALSGASLSAQGTISGDTLNITHAATLGSLKVAGTFTAQQIASDGPIYFPTSGPNAPGLGAQDDHSFGLYYGPGGTLGFAAAGATVLSFSSQGAGHLTGPLQAAAVAATALSAQTLAISGATQLQALTATTLQLSGAATLASDLSVQGTTRLANLAIDQITTDHDLTVGGNATIKGNTSCQGTLAATGAVQFGQGLQVANGGNFGGAVISGSVSTGGVVLTGLRAILAGGNQPVLVEPVPGGVIKYSVTLDNQGDLALSGTFGVLGAATLSGTLAVAGALTGAAASFTGPVSSQAAVTGALSTFGGSTFQTCQGSPNGQLTGSVGDYAIDRQSGLAYLKFSGSQTQAGWVEVTTQANATGFPLLAPTGPDTSAPPYSFADDARSGLGRTLALPLYLAVAGNLGLSFDGSGNATFAQGLAVSGPTSLAGLTAGATTLASLSAQATTVTTLQAASGQISGGFSVGGSLGAGASTLASLTVTGQTHLMGQVACDASLTSQTYVAAPVAKVGGSALSAGNGPPNGAVTGSRGDGYFEQDNGTWWIKSTGQGTQTGWASIATSATATAFPLSAPLANNLSAPSYGFAGSMMGITDQGANVLVGVTGGRVGWRLNASANMEVLGTLLVDGQLTSQVSSVLAAAQATTLQVSGATQLAAVSASGTATLATVTATSATVAGALTAGQLVSQGTVLANGSTWTAAGQAPTSGGQAGDFTTVQAGSIPLYVRTSSAWRAVQLVGDPAPSQFPLRGTPADSASAPNFAPSANYPGAGMFLAGANILGFATNGVSAGTIDANGNWTLAGTLAAGAATFPSLQVNGTVGATGAVSFGSTLQVTGGVTLASSLSAASVASSGAVSGTNGSFSGTLSGQTLNVTGNATIAGTLTVNGATTYNGVQKAPYYQAGDGSLGSPSFAFSSEPALGWWRSAAGTLSAQAGNANILSLTAATAAFSGTLNVGNNNAGILSPAANVLQLQAGGTVGFTLNPSAVIAGLPLTVPAGTTSAPGLQVGGAAGLTAAYDARPTFPVSVSLLNPRGAAIALTTVPDSSTNSNYFILGAGTGGITSGPFAPNGYANGAPGFFYAYSGGGSGTSAYVYEGTSNGNNGWVAIRTASQPVVPSYPAVGPAGTAAAPTFAVGSPSSGLYAGTDFNSRAFVGLSQGGAAVCRLATFQNNSTQVYVVGLGDPTSSSISGGLVASAQAPSTGAPAAFPAMLYQDTRGGAAQSLWVNESTTSTPAFAKVLTTSSPAANPSFPLVGPVGSAAAPTFQVGSNNGLFATSTLVGLAFGGAQVAAFTTALASLPGALQIGGTNAGLTSPGANALALQTAGNTALSFAATGVATFAFQALHTAGTAALPGVAVSATNYGLYLSAAANQANEGSVSVSYKGKSVGNFFQGAIGTTGNTYYAMTLGDAAQTTQLGGVLAGASTPVGNITGLGGQLYQYTPGGAATSLYVYEGTASGNSAWAKVLTTSSPVSPTFPILAPSGTAAAPTYSYSASSSTGVSYFADQGSGGTPSVGLVSGGKVCAYSNFQTANSTTIYNLILGDPTVNASPYPVSIRASAQAASGNIIGAPGQIAINNTGGVGTVLAVKETGVGTSTGWSLALTTGTVQIAGQNGTAAAPYYSYLGDKTSGGFFGDLPYISHAGKTAVGFGSTFGGSYVGLTLGSNSADTNAYIIGVPSTAANAGNPNTIGIGAGRACLMLNAAGAAGNQIWLHEPTSSASGWVRVLTESTALSFSRLLQTTAPAAVSGQTLAYADTAAGRINFVTSASSAAGVQPFLQPQIAATVYGGTQTILAAQNGITAVSTGATQFTLTLPASVAYDLVYRFQVESSAGVVIKANTSQVIQYGTSASTTGGTLTSTAVGSTVELFLRAGTNTWYARGPAGNWTTA